MSVTAPHPAPEQPATPAKKRRRWPWITGGAVVLIIILATATSHGGTSTGSTAAPAASSAVPAPATHAPLAAAAAPATTAAPAAPVVLYSKTGTGTGSTPTFTTGSEWQVAYTYDCTAFGQSGNFAVTSEDFQLVINQLGMKGADTEYVHSDPGSHSLSIDSECAWTIKVLG